MAAGLPVVVYDLPVFREFLKDGEHGYVVPLDDHRQVADRLLELLQNDSLRREISRRNAEYARRFTWERATDQEEEVLFSVLARRPEKPGGARDDSPHERSGSLSKYTEEASRP